MDETEKNRLKWSTDQIKCFLETCIEEVNKVGRNGMSLQKDTWAKLAKKLYEVCGMKVTQKQMKNQYDYMRGKYSGWVYLRGKTGNIYNPQTNTFNLTNQEWADFIKGHPQAKSLKKTPLAFPERCAALYDGTSATGARHWAPSANFSRPGSSSSYNSQNNQTFEFEDNTSDDEEGENINNNSGSVPLSNREGPGVSVCNTDDSKPKRKGKLPANKWTQLEENMSNALVAMVEGPKGTSMKDCIDKLKTVGLGTTSPLYLEAFGIFGDSLAHREAWLMLDSDPEVLVGWIMAVGANMGYLN